MNKLALLALLIFFIFLASVNAEPIHIIWLDKLIGLFVYDGWPTIYFWLALIFAAIALDNFPSYNQRRKEKKQKAKKYYQKLDQEKAEALAEAKRKEEEIETKRKKEKEEAKLKAAEAKRKKEEEAKLKAAEAKRKKEEAEAKRKKEEAEAKRKKEEAEAKRKKEKAEAKRREEEAEAKRKKEEAEAKRREEEAEAKQEKRIQKKSNFKEIDVDQDAENLLELRHSAITVSDAPTVMEVDDLRTPETLIDIKRNKVNTKPTQKMLKELSIEPEARVAYIEETGIEVEPLWLQHNEFPWLIARVSGISSDYKHIVEIKSGATAYLQARNKKITDYCNVQLQHLMMITGLDKIDYWCYWQGRKGILQVVERDDEFIDKLFQAELEFINSLTNEEDQ